jgi:hypothetical protein
VKRSDAFTFLAGAAVIPLVAPAIAACATAWPPLLTTGTSGRGVTAFGAAWYALTPVGGQISIQTTTSGGGYAH